MMKKLILSLAVVGTMLIPTTHAQAGRIVYRNGWSGRWAQPYYGNRVYRYGYYPRPYYGGYYGGYYARPYGTFYYNQPYGVYYSQPYGGYYVNGAYVAPYYPVY